MAQNLYVGVDIGSATVKVAGIDDASQLIGTPVYLRHDRFASPTEALTQALEQYLQSAPGTVAGLGATGSGRELNKRLLGADISRTEIFAHAVGVQHLVESGSVRQDSGAGRQPVSEVGSVIEIGGQDAKVIIFGADGLPALFNMNTICSAGTGEFLKQLADEAGITLADFGAVALGSRRPAHIDATCTVFAKRDFRHLTQKGVALADRLMGACRAMVRNYLTNVVQGACLRPPILFQGGVAFNQAVRRAFAEQLGVAPIVPPHNDIVGALGMAVIVRAAMLGRPDPTSRFRPDFARRKFHNRVRYCHGCANSCDLAEPYEEVQGEVVVLETLGGRCAGAQNPHNVKAHAPSGAAGPGVQVQRRTAPRRRLDVANPAAGQVRCSGGRYFAGLDGGSRGTKFALIQSLGDAPPGQNLKVVAAGAVATGGDAIAACREALARLQTALPPGGQLSGIGTTGSAGELLRDIITRRDAETADRRVSEIIAHYAWATYWQPDVSTVMDIGGNDAKLIAVSDGGLDFAMNDKCAAGTGSFLEAVARRFGVAVSDYAAIALTSANPVRIAGRCAVFGESDIVHKSRAGFPTADLLLGLAYAICRTYFSDVARGLPIVTPIVAQGGAFLNRAVQHAFRQTLGLGPQEFIVADDPRYVLGAGALGAALLARSSWEQGHETHFKGFEAIRRSRYESLTTVCAHPDCGRRCTEVVMLLEDGAPIAGYRSIDCPLGQFSGLARDPEQRQHMERVLSGGG